MKRLSLSAKQRNLRLTLWGLRKRQKRALAGVRRRKKHANVKPRLRVDIVAPERFCIRRTVDRSKFISFLDAVESALGSGGRPRLNFSKVSELQPCGTLVFRARLDTWLHAYPARITCTYPKNDIVEQLFQHIGILELLGLQSRKAEITHDHVRDWHYHCGSRMDASIYRELTLSIRDRIDHPERALFADCLNEAVYNTVNHAYEFEAPGLPAPDQRKWWMFSQVKDGRLFVAIYDFGVSIPASLLRRPEWRDYARLRSRDGHLIEAAAASERTSTKLSHRGKGLPEMLEFSRKLRDGGLSIISRRGAFVFTAGSGHLQRRKYPVPLPGTLVLWEMPFLGRNDNG